ncbi:homoserine dehydrogenase [Bryobacterales bacterium F-183]|nr:homoserine dehydrogenase [Bryobacterales bacterium F-183]
MRIALVGYGNVGRAFARLLDAKRSVFPFLISGIQKRNSSAINLAGLHVDTPINGPRLDVGDFLDQCQAEVMIEITTLEPATGEPAISHIRAAFQRGIHVITANKGPLAHAYAALCQEAMLRQCQFRFESTCMDGAPVFNMVRNCLPGVDISGFTGVLNSTSKVVIAAMRDGKSMEDGIREAQRMGIAEADASYDIDGWDSAAKTATLANVLLNANRTPLDVDRKGIGRLTPEKLEDLKSQGKTVALVSRAHRTPSGELKMRVRAEVLPETDILASLQGTSNLLLLHTDLMGTVGTVAITPGVEQTAYGLFSDLVDITKSL